MPDHELGEKVRENAEEMHITKGDLEAPEKFAALVERLVGSGELEGMYRRDAWALRAHCFRMAKNPPAMFGTLVRAKDFHKISTEDDQEGGQDYQDYQASLPGIFNTMIEGKEPTASLSADSAIRPPLTAQEMDARKEAVMDYDPCPPGEGLLSFREFAVGELGDGAKDWPHPQVMTGLYEKCKREGWRKLLKSG